MPSLRSLTISHGLLDQASLQPLDEALAHRSGVLQHLTMLSLRGSSCQGAPPGVDPATSRNLQTLASILTCMPALEHIDLCRCGLTASRVGLLVPALKCLEHLRYIDVGENELGYHGVALLSAAWSGLKHMQTLKLDDVLWGGPAFDGRGDAVSVMALIDSIEELTMLQHLSLGHFAVASESDNTCAVMLAAALLQLSSLQSLSMRCTGWWASSMRCLTLALCNHKQLCSLTVDAYSHERTADCTGEMAAFGSGLSALTSLVKLEVHCRANVCALEELAHLTGLKELTLRRLQLPDEHTCCALGSALSGLQALQKLAILQPGLRTKNAVHFAPVLGGLTQLTELALDIDSRPTTIPEEVFAEIQSRYVIDTAECGIEAVAEEIARLPLLKVLDIGDQGKKLDKSELYAVSRALSTVGRSLDVFNGMKWTPWCFDEWWDIVYSGDT